jgi:hypothetical protein
MAKIKIRIEKNGTTHFDVSGVTGSDCETLTEALTRSLGDIEETNYKEEYVQENPDFIHSFEE